MTADTIPTYIYRTETPEPSLLQGDILKVEGQFRQYFADFYPAVTDLVNEDKYVMVLTQSCDLVKNEKRRPKLDHINVCLVRSLKVFIQKLIVDEIKPFSVAGKNLLAKNTLDQF